MPSTVMGRALPQSSFHVQNRGCVCRKLCRRQQRFLARQQQRLVRHALEFEIDYAAVLNGHAIVLCASNLKSLPCTFLEKLKAYYVCNCYLNKMAKLVGVWTPTVNTFVCIIMHGSCPSWFRLSFRSIRCGVPLWCLRVELKKEKLHVLPPYTSQSFEIIFPCQEIVFQQNILSTVFLPPSFFSTVPTATRPPSPRCWWPCCFLVFFFSLLASSSRGAWLQPWCQSFSLVRWVIHTALSCVAIATCVCYLYTLKIEYDCETNRPIAFFTLEPI